MVAHEIIIQSKHEMDYYPNQEHYFNSIGIYDMDNDLRMIIDSEMEQKIKKTLHVMIKKFGKETLFDSDGNTIKSEIIKVVYDMIKKYDSDCEIEDEENIENYIKYLIN
jgi:hypothetical protein